jgi:asparagine synthase (glutamine-hydrolysing)
MSGICGYVSFDKEKVIGGSFISSMVASMQNADTEGSRGVINRNIGLGLCSFDLQNHFFADNEVVVLATGEAYGLTGNFARIIAELYHQYKEGCVEHLEGQFNFCIWDKNEEKLLLFTDRFGTSILNYYFDAQHFIFASKIRAILKTNLIEPAIDKNAIYNYLVFSFVPTPETIYREIKKLPPGHLLVLNNSKINLRKYWDISYIESRNKGEGYYCRKIRETLEEAVRKRFNPENQRIGAFLSGGLDSSTVSGLMKNICQSEVRTFSIGFREDAYNEIEYVDIAAKHFGLKSYKYYVEPGDLIEAIKVLVKEYDEPFGNSSAIATYFCMKLAKDNGVDILLGGDGGDENFAGYERYVTDKLFSLYSYIPSFLRKTAIDPCVHGLPFKNSWFVNKVRNYTSHANIPNPERFFLYPLYPVYKRKEIFTEDFLKYIVEDSPLKFSNELFNAADTSHELNKLAYLDAKLGLIDNDLRNKMDKTAQLLGLSVRYPMLDTELWELGAEIPYYLKLKGFNKKYIYKQAFKDFLPKEIILKKKHGFGLPYAAWLRSDKSVRKFTEEILLDDKVAKRGYFKKGFFENMLRLHDEDKSPYYGDILWIFLMLEIWHNEWINKI